MGEEDKETEKGSRRKIAGVLIPAGLFIGMGIGWAIDKFLPGMYIGLGVGFLAFVIVWITVRD